MGTTASRLRRTGLLALAVVLALGVAACGGDDDAQAVEGDEEARERSIGGETTLITVPTDGEPAVGGAVIYGLEAETDGWNPIENRWAVSGHTVAYAVFDPLATWSEEGEAVPYLAEAFEPNEDFTVWDIVLRSGVRFHDETPLTADAVVKLLNGHLDSALTAPALEPVEEVEALDELTVRVTMNEPWAVFPVVLTGQPGYVPAPAQLDSPEASREAIGTGPFIQQSWVPDREFVAVRNENYWREGLPYLNQVTFRPMPDVQTRLDSLSAGGINMTVTTNPDWVLRFRERSEEGEFQMMEDGSVGEQTFVLLNTLVPPLDDVRVRRAMALAINREVYIDTIGAGILLEANSPFSPNSPWYNPEVADAFPQYDPDEARRLVEEYEAEVGPIEFDFVTTPVTANMEALALIAAQWEAVGIRPRQSSKEQATFILDAVTGNFEANLWRQFGAPDPDGEYVWWVSQNANDIDEFSLNMARNRNPSIDEAMTAGRQTDDFEERKAAYDEVQVLLAEDLPYLWVTHTLWGLIADTSVRNLGVFTTPDGEPALAFNNGRYALTELWIE